MPRFVYLYDNMFYVNPEQVNAARSLGWVLLPDSTDNISPPSPPNLWPVLRAEYADTPHSERLVVENFWKWVIGLRSWYKHIDPPWSAPPGGRFIY